MSEDELSHSERVQLHWLQDQQRTWLADVPKLNAKMDELEAERDALKKEVERLRNYPEDRLKSQTVRPLLLERLQDLLKQATTEHTHYYTAEVLSEAIAEIVRLRVLKPESTPNG